MGEIATISFSDKTHRILVHKSLLRGLKMPQYIRFLLNKKSRCIAVQACDPVDRDIFKVPEMKADDSYEISSAGFVAFVYKLAEWDKEKSYRIEGTFYPGNRLAEFDLSRAWTIAPEQFTDNEEETLRME